MFQENLEHAIAHGHVLGLGALLGPEHPFALVVLPLVTFLAAFLAAAVWYREAALQSSMARCFAARGGLRKLLLPRPQRAQARRPALMGQNAAVRGPPLVALSLPTRHSSRDARPAWACAEENQTHVKSQAMRCHR
jgi:hypothetical protein